MSKSFKELNKMATSVRNHYNKLQEIDGYPKWSATERMAGFVKDVGDLSKLIMVKDGLRRGSKNINQELEHELSDCLWSVMVIADELNIDLEVSFVDSMEKLHRRIDAEGKAGK